MKTSKLKAVFVESNGSTVSVEIVFYDDNGYAINPPRVILWRDGAAKVPRSVEVTTLS